MSANLTLNMEARLDEIERIHTAVEILAEAEGWPEDLLFQIKLVVEGMGTNIVKYGYESEGQQDVSITLTSESHALTMEIVDGGKPFDPFSEASPPDRWAWCLSRAKADGRGPLRARGREEQADVHQAQEVMTRPLLRPAGVALAGMRRQAPSP